MINSKQIVLTYEGLERLEKELEYLKTVKRKEIAEKIKQALAFGDLTENSEYDEAKNEQAYYEHRIIQLEKILKNAKVIDEDEVDTEVVSIGSKVKILDIELNKEMEYILVGSTEADPSRNKISNESPLGKILLGKKEGDIVNVVVPKGTIEYKILSISK